MNGGRSNAGATHGEDHVGVGATLDLLATIGLGSLLLAGALATVAGGSVLGLGLSSAVLVGLQKDG